MTTDRNGGDGDGGDGLPNDIEALKAALAEERRKHGALANENRRIKAARDELTSKFKAWGQLEDEGYAPEQVRALMSQARDEDLQKARSQGEIDKLLEAQRAHHERELARERERAERIRQTNEQLFVHDVLNRALDDIGVEPKLKRGAFNLHLPRIRVIEDPEAPYGMATVAMVGDDHMDIDAYLKTWVDTDEEAGAYLQKTAGNGRDWWKRKARKDMSASEKSKYIRAYGKTAYDKIPWSND